MDQDEVCIVGERTRTERDAVGWANAIVLDSPSAPQAENANTNLGTDDSAAARRADLERQALARNMARKAAVQEAAAKKGIVRESQPRRARDLTMDGKSRSLRLIEMRQR